MSTKKADILPKEHIIADRRLRKWERRLDSERREAIRWEPERENRRQVRQDRRESARSPWDNISKPT